MRLHTHVVDEVARVGAQRRAIAQAQRGLAEALRGELRRQVTEHQHLDGDGALLTELWLSLDASTMITFFLDAKLTIFSRV